MNDKPNRESGYGLASSMSIRDHFAAMAMQSLIIALGKNENATLGSTEDSNLISDGADFGFSSGIPNFFKGENSKEPLTYGDMIAGHAYCIADAMLSERCS